MTREPRRPRPEHPEVDAEALDRRAERLKERVYVTFAALAVVMTMRGHVTGSGAAARTLVITVGGTLLAVLVADLVSHVVVHQELPHRTEIRHFLQVTRSGLGPVVLPLVFLGLSGLGVWELDGAAGVDHRPAGHPGRRGVGGGPAAAAEPAATGGGARRRGGPGRGRGAAGAGRAPLTARLMTLLGAQQRPGARQPGSR